MKMKFIRDSYLSQFIVQNIFIQLNNNLQNMLSTKLITRATIKVNSQPIMIQNRYIGGNGGFADKVTGAIKEKLGWAMGNDKMQSEGSAQKSRGETDLDMGKNERSFSNQSNKSSHQYSSGSQMKEGSSNNLQSEGKSQSGAWNQSKGKTEGWNASGQPEAMQMGNGQEGTKEMKGQADGLKKETRGQADGWNHTKGQEGWNSQTKGPSDAWSNTIGLGEGIENKGSSQAWDKNKGSQPGLQNKGTSDATWGKTDKKTSEDIGSEDALSKKSNLGEASWNKNDKGDMSGSINENILRNQSVGMNDIDKKATSEARRNQASDLKRGAGEMPMNRANENKGSSESKDGKGGVKK